MLKISALLFIALLIGSMSFAQPTALEIIQKSDIIRAAPNWGFSLEIIDYEKEGDQIKVLSTNNYRVTAITEGEYPEAEYKAVAFFLAPKEVEGQKNLKTGQIYWQFFPSTKNLVRVSGAQRMAGQVSAADIASSNYANDYDGKIIGEEQLLKKDCFKLELAQKNPEVAYFKLVYWVEKVTFNPVKVEFYAVSDKLLKTAYFRDFKEVKDENSKEPALNTVKPHEMFIVDPLKPGHITRMLYSGIKEEKMPETFFRKANLETAQSPK